MSAATDRAADRRGLFRGLTDEERRRLDDRLRELAGVGAAVAAEPGVS